MHIDRVLSAPQIDLSAHADKKMVILYVYLRICTKKGVGYLAWKWIRISLKSWMVSWYKNKIVRAGVSNCMGQQHLNFLVLNVHSPAYLGSRGKTFFQTLDVFLLCLPIVDQ